MKPTAITIRPDSLNRIALESANLYQSAFCEMTMTKPTLINAPSLLDAAGPTTLAAPGLLSSLDGAASHAADKKQTRSAFRFIAIPLILIGLLAIAAAMIASNSATSFRPLVSSASSPAVESASKSGAIGDAKPRAAATEAAPIQVATIINDPAVTPEKQAAEPVITSGNTLHDRLSAALTSPQQGQAAEATKMTGVAKSGSLKPATTKTKVARADNEDRDVRLLTALIVTDKDIPVKKESHAHAGSKISAKQNAKAKDDARNQDIVERKPGDSTASLLIRCKKLGLVEGELCRWRICSERWDSDPACKANSQSKTSAADIPNQ